MPHPALGAPTLKLALGAAAATAAAAAVALSPGEAKAVLIYNIFQSGSDVVISTRGSLNLNSPTANNLKCAASGAIVRQVSLICTGTGQINMNKYNVSLMGSDGLFSNIIPDAFASSVSGTYNTNLTGSGTSPLYFGTNAPSGDPIISTTTFANTTLATLGFNTTGLIGTWSLVSTGDLIQVVVGPPPPPVPGPLPLLGAGAAFGWSRRMRRRLAAPADQKPEP